MKELTRAELQIMQILWKIQSGFLKEIHEQFPQPRPATTTVSTMLRILVKKEFLTFDSFGKQHRYRPLVSKKAYAKARLKGFLGQFFDGSPQALLSFFAADNDMSLKELEEMQSILQDEIQNKKVEP